MGIGGKRLYLAEASGMLGEGFHQVFGDRCGLRATDIQVDKPGLSPLDFRDFDAYRIDE